MWDKLERETRMNPSNAPYVLESKLNKNKVRYVDKLEAKFPTYLHSLYRYATSTLGVDENSTRLVQAMNQRSNRLHPNCPIRSDLGLNKHHFWEFFYKHGGKIKADVTKPRLSLEQREERVLFATKWKSLLEKDALEKELPKKIYRCYLDEKWFYTSSRRRKVKVLPRAQFESVKQSFVKNKKVRTRRHPCKVMFMAVVAPPIEEQNFSGIIYFRRVGNVREQKRESHNQNFHSLYTINGQLRMGEWKDLIDVSTSSSLLPSNLLMRIGVEYTLPPLISENLCFLYESFEYKSKKRDIIKRKWVQIDKKDNKPLLVNRFKKVVQNGQLISKPVNLSDLHLRVNQQPGHPMWDDVSCNSDFMMKVVDDIGDSIRKAHNFIPHTTPVYLFVENAGGHGKKEIKSEFVEILKKNTM